MSPTYVLVIQRDPKPRGRRIPWTQLPLMPPILSWVNFLDDRSQAPHMKLTAIDKVFGVGESTGQGKSMLIRKMFKIRRFDKAWTLPCRLEQNPAAWMIEINRFVVDARILKRELQEIAFNQGLIPYIPERPPTLDEDGEDEIE